MFEKTSVKLEKTKLINFIVFGIFIIYLFLNFWKLGAQELAGDEASYLIAIIPAMKFYKKLLWLPSPFLFGHGFLVGLLEIPFLYIFGLNEFWLRIPSVFLNIGLFFVVLKILKKFFSDSAVAIGLIFLAVNGSIILQRKIYGTAPFLFFSSLMIYFLCLYFNEEETTHFKYSLLFLFLTILTYTEAIIFIPIMFFWLWQKQEICKKEIRRNIIVFLGCLLLYFSAWIIMPFLALKIGYVSDISNLGMIRIFKRSSSGFSLQNLGYGWKMIRAKNSLFFSVLIALGLSFSLFNKKSYFFWSFLLPPLIYFTLKSNPMLHFFNYLNFVVILSTFGWAFILDKINKASKLSFAIFYLILFFAMLTNLKKFKYLLFEQNNEGLKSGAYLVREKTDICDKIYTDIEGHTARIYFGRSYVKDKSNADFVILKNNLSQEVELENEFNKSYSSFKNMLPYLGNCEK